jgi:hypothetical protein
MILRALFWIAVIAILMPHEPDLGFGRPGAQASMLPSIPSLMGMMSSAAGEPAKACGQHENLCAGTLTTLDSFQSVAIRGLSEVKAEIEAQQRLRRQGG